MFCFYFIETEHNTRFANRARAKHWNVLLLFYLFPQKLLFLLPPPCRTSFRSITITKKSALHNTREEKKSNPPSGNHSKFVPLSLSPDRHPSLYSALQREGVFMPMLIVRCTTLQRELSWYKWSTSRRELRAIQESWASVRICVLPVGLSSSSSSCHDTTKQLVGMGRVQAKQSARKKKEEQECHTVFLSFLWCWSQRNVQLFGKMCLPIPNIVQHLQGLLNAIQLALRFTSQLLLILQLSFQHAIALLLCQKDILLLMHAVRNHFQNALRWNWPANRIAGVNCSTTTRVARITISTIWWKGKRRAKIAPVVSTLRIKGRASWLQRWRWSCVACLSLPRYEARTCSHLMRCRVAGTGRHAAFRIVVWRKNVW